MNKRLSSFIFTFLLSLIHYQCNRPHGEAIRDSSHIIFRSTKRWSPLLVCGGIIGGYLLFNKITQKVILCQQLTIVLTER